jgi:anti-anti-sigma factor
MTERTINLETGAQQVVRVCGCVDLTNSHEFRSAIETALQNGPQVVIDVSQADMLDSSAISTLGKAYKRAKDIGVNLSLTVSNNLTMRILQLSGLASAFGLCVLKSDVDDDLPIDNPDLRRQDWRITESVAIAEREMVVPLRDVAIMAAREIGMSPESIADIKVALTEALANALFHGSPNPGKSRIGMRCLSCTEAFVLEVTDEGKGIDADEVAANQTGFGTKLMKAVMDEVEFLRTERGGRVRMIKWIRNGG